MSVYDQDGYRCRVDWGRQGARKAARRGDVLVIVDVLSFSSAAVAAVARGAVVYPCAKSDDLAALTRRHDAQAAVHRTRVPQDGRFSLSPLTFLEVAPATRILLASPNGATCSRYGQAVRHLFVGCLNNATAVAAAVSRLLEETDLDVTVIACGERWEEANEDGELRFALEDFLGAGAILAGISRAKSPEASVCEAAFRGADLRSLLWDCASGRELRAIGFGGDVEHAARLDLYDAVPVMRGERLERLVG